MDNNSEACLGSGMNIQESLQQILSSKQAFGQQFYKKFFERCPEVMPFFADVNLDRQAVLLTMALLVIEKQHTSPFAAAEEYLRYLGTKHQQWNIPKPLYTAWTAVMLETLEHFLGDEWNESLAKEWEAAIARVIELMFQGYDQRYTV